MDVPSNVPTTAVNDTLRVNRPAHNCDTQIHGCLRSVKRSLFNVANIVCSPKLTLSYLVSTRKVSKT